MLRGIEDSRKRIDTDREEAETLRRDSARLREEIAKEKEAFLKQKNELLATYDKEYMGRNRRYYHVTPKGEKALEEYRREWKKHKNMVDRILLEKGGENT